MKHVFEQEGVFNESPDFPNKAKNHTVLQIKFEKYGRLKKKTPSFDL